MKTQRVEAYLELIQRLLDCPKGQELALLQANETLIDEGLVQVMDEVAAQLNAQGDGATATFLQDWAEELRNVLKPPASKTVPLPETEKNQAYMTLIKELLACRKGAEADILRTHAELVDAGLVQHMEKVATMLKEKGDEADAHFLFSLAEQLAETLSLSSSSSRLILLKQILQAIQESGGSAQVVYPLLQDHLDQIDEAFITVLRDWSEEALRAADPKRAVQLALDLVLFSELIQQFANGNPDTNREIALTALQFALAVFRKEDYPQQWALIQNNLGMLYCHRQVGEGNIEAAIRCFQAALQVYTPAAFAKEWTIVQANLADAYTHRTEGDRVRNLEQAISGYQAALLHYLKEQAPERRFSFQQPGKAIV